MMPAMTERQGFDETPTACPFLAFEDDRDFRSDRPDHRHRCFAEARPAPRAIAHQELFCVGGAFAQCPTFLEWAAREAAVVKRPSVRRPVPPTPGAGTSRAAAVVGPATSPPPPSRNRDWLAPPPWLAAEHATDAIPDEANAAPGDGHGPGLFGEIEPPMDPTGARGGSTPISRESASASPGSSPARAAAPASPADEVAPPPFLAGRSRPAPPSDRAGSGYPPSAVPGAATAGTAAVGAVAAGAAHSAASGAGTAGLDGDDDLASLLGTGARTLGAQIASPSTGGPPSAAPSPPPTSGRPPSSQGGSSPAAPVSGSSRAPYPPYTTSRDDALPFEPDDAEDLYDGALDYGVPGADDEIAAAAAARIARAKAESDAAPSGGSRFSVPGRKQSSGSGQARPLPQRAADPSAPAWERPRRFEAYPAIKSERRMPGIPKVAIWAGLLALAAVALFLIPPLLLGGGDGGASASPTPRGTAAVSDAPSPSPTRAPEPTPTTYTVKKDDTLSGIAAKYKVTVDDLLAANPDLKDPNRLQIGDKIVIPLPPSQTIPDGGTIPGASPSP
jgi:hypothetical protein